jgi:hypothetical protein
MLIRILLQSYKEKEIFLILIKVKFWPGKYKAQSSALLVE